MSDAAFFTSTSRTGDNLDTFHTNVEAALALARRATVLDTTSTPTTLAADYDVIIGDTSGGGVTVNLPASPSDGDNYLIICESASNDVTVGRNGNTINGAGSDTTLSGAHTWGWFTWNDSSSDWIRIDGSGTGGGGLSAPTVASITNADSPYTVPGDNYVVVADASSGAITVNLPAVSGKTASIWVKKTDSSANAITIDGNGAETIDDSTTKILNVQYQALRVHPDGTEWWIL